jgi:hypothetical protein
MDKRPILNKEWRIVKHNFDPISSSYLDNLVLHFRGPKGESVYHKFKKLRDNRLSLKPLLSITLPYIRDHIKASYNPAWINTVPKRNAKFSYGDKTFKPKKNKSGYLPGICRMKLRSSVRKKKPLPISIPSSSKSSKNRLGKD